MSARRADGGGKLCGNFVIADNGRTPGAFMSPRRPVPLRPYDVVEEPLDSGGDLAEDLGGARQRTTRWAKPGHHGARRVRGVHQQGCVRAEQPAGQHHGRAIAGQGRSG